MNELIIELADKAVEDVSSGPWNISDEFCIKFAELIIRECSRVYIQNQQDGVMTLTQDLLQHFGVEE